MHHLCIGIDTNTSHSTILSAQEDRSALFINAELAQRVSYDDIDRLFRQSGAAQYTYSYVTELNNEINRFDTFDNLVDGVKQRHQRMQTLRQDLYAHFHHSHCTLFRESPHEV